MKAKKQSVKIQDKNNKAEKFDVYDSWDNFLSLIGGETFSGKAKNFSHTENQRLDYPELDAMFSSDSIASKVCVRPAQDMLRQGIDIDHKKAKKIYDLHEKYNVSQLLEDAIIFDNVYGGSAIILDIDDGREWSEPVDENNIIGLKEAFVVDRFWLNPDGDWDGLKEPEIYQLSGTSSKIDKFNLKIHNSRLIKFSGINSGLRNRQWCQSFGESKILKLQEELRNYGIAHNLIIQIITQFTQDIFKFKDMTKQIRNGDGAKIKKKARYLQATRNILNAMVIDQDDDFITKTVNVSGVKDLVSLVEKRLCASANMPHTRLLEESPGGTLSNNGDNSEQSKQYYDYIQAERVKKLTPAYNRFHFIFSKLLKLGKNPIKWEFCPLRQESQKEIIENRNKQANTDKIYFDMGLPAKIIFKERFGEGYYSFETSLEEDEMNENMSEEMDMEENQ